MHSLHRDIRSAQERGDTAGRVRAAHGAPGGRAAPRPGRSRHRRQRRMAASACRRRLFEDALFTSGMWRTTSARRSMQALVCSCCPRSTKGSACPFWRRCPREFQWWLRDADRFPKSSARGARSSRRPIRTLSRPRSSAWSRTRHGPSPRLRRGWRGLATSPGPRPPQRFGGPTRTPLHAAEQRGIRTHVGLGIRAQASARGDLGMKAICANRD